MKLISCFRQSLVSVQKFFKIASFHGKEKDALENEAKTKKDSRTDVLEKAKQIKVQINYSHSGGKMYITTFILQTNYLQKIVVDYLEC